MDELLPDLIEVVEHIAYSHNYRSETTQKRVGELLTGIRARLLAALEQKKAADAAAAPAPTPPATSAPVTQALTMLPEPIPVSTPAPDPVISQPEVSA